MFFVLVITWFRVKLTINLTSGFHIWQVKLSSSKVLRKLWRPLSYHGWNLSLIARETMRLLVNYQLILIAAQPKSITLEQICHKRCEGIAVTSLNCLLFSMSKNNDLKRILKSATKVVLLLNFWTSKFVFTL